MKLSLPQLPVRLAVGALLLLAASPALCAQAPQAAPNLTPKRPKSHAASAASADAEPDRSVPVATVNGVAVYRPLMHSIVSSPVDRALLLMEYHKTGAGMSAGDKDFVAKQLELAQFNGDDKRLDARLRTLDATRDDYRQFAVEEAKLRDVLRAIAHGAHSPAQAERQRAEYLAQLRRNASINATRH